MKVYRYVAIALSIIVGLALFISLISLPDPQMAFNDPVTEEHYKLLKENCLNVGRTLSKNALNDETLTADFSFTGEKLIVEVESIKAKVTAYIPISAHLLNVENEIINFNGKAEFENVEFVRQNKLNPAWCYILLYISGSIYVAFTIYILIFKAWTRPKD